MRPLKVRTSHLALCALAVAMCVHGSPAAGVELVHRDGFEPLEPQALVLEAVNRSSGIRSSAVEYWYSTLQLPASLGVLAFEDPYPAGPALATLRSGNLLLNFDGDLAGKSLAFALWLQADALRWVCGYAPPPLDAALLSGSGSSANTNLRDAVLPDACRQSPSPMTLIDEAWLATETARLAVAEYWASVGPPASLADVGLDDPLPVARARLALDDGLLVATFVDPLAGETLAIAPWLQAGALCWVCGHAPPPVDATLLSGTASPARTSLPEAWLPEACRSDPSLETQVHEVLRGMAAARLAISEFWSASGALPATLAQAGVQDPQPVAQARLRLDEGVLVATFVGDLDGERLGVALWERGGALFWVCGYAMPPPGATPLASSTAAAKTTLDVALLPDGCR